MDGLVAMLRAAGDPTRLRLLLLLRQAELTVSELIEIVGQSQPRVSRHLRLLVEAGLAGFLWGGLGLAVVHLVVPDRFRLPAGHGFAGGGEELDFLAEADPLPVKSAWEDAQAFWYDLPQEAVHARR